MTIVLEFILSICIFTFIVLLIGRMCYEEGMDGD